MKNELEGFSKTQERDATDEISIKLLEYGEDVLYTKFPNCVDGLKSSTRRIIWASQKYRDAQGFGKMVGDVADQHVGGESSIVDAVIRLSQSFQVGHPLISVEGKNGEYYDPKAFAAPRYLKAAISKFAYDIFFEGINERTIPKIDTKDFMGKEPRYLIPKLPTALLLGNLTVGFGYKSSTPMLDIEDVCDLVMKFSKYQQSGGLFLPDSKDIAANLVPRFPVRNLIKNRKDVIREYSKGNYTYPVSIEGWMELSGDTITLRAVPYGADFGKVTNTLRDRLRNAKSELYQWIDTANNLSADEAEFSIRIKRGNNPFEVVDRLRGILKFNGSIHPIFYYLNGNNNIAELPPPVLTDRWYKERSLSIAGELKYRQTSLILRKYEINAMLIVVDRIDEVVDIIRQSELEDVVPNLHAKFLDLTLNQAKIIANQKLTVLAKTSRKQLESELEQVEAELKEVADDFGRINEIIYNDAQLLKKKYKSTSLTRFSEDFIGYVQFGRLGIINFFDYDDMRQILNTKGWPVQAKRSIHLYDKRTPRKFIVKSGYMKELDELSKEITCEQILCYPENDRDELTLVINPDKTTCIVEAGVTDLGGDRTLCPISKSFYAVHRNGSVTAEVYTDYSIRKTACKGAKTDLVYGLSGKLTDVIVVHMNSKDPNTLRIDHILQPGKLGNLKLVPAGKTHILCVVPFNTKEIFLNIPEDCRKGTTMEHLIVTDLKNIFKEPGDNKSLNLLRNNDGYKFKRDSETRSLYFLKL